MDDSPKHVEFPSDSSQPFYKSSVRAFSSQKNRSTPSDISLFSTEELSQRTETFDIAQPCLEMNDKVLQEQNPILFAMRNKAVTIRPEVGSPKHRAKTANARLGSSLLQRRPLTALKDPDHVESIEIGKRRIEEERQTISFQEDPVAYFSKRKDGRGHRFIYLVYKGDPKDPYFSPYELDKVPSALIGENFFTMSATGVTHSYPDGTTETMTLSLWAQEKSIFDSIRKLKFFFQYFFWKPFRIWRNFVMQQRYTQLVDKAIGHPFFRNDAFFKQSLEFYQLQLTSYEMLRTLLLTFHSQKKYRLDEFLELSTNNIDKLENDYSDFINMTTQNIKNLYLRISDPTLVQVQDSDFPQIKRRNPNITQLMTLERTKATKRVENTRLVNDEIGRIGSYIRMIDYMLLETLVDGCVKCWKIADANVSQAESMVFQVEVLFDDEGNVAFYPLHDDLLNSISDTLDKSIITLKKLPRIIYQPPLKPFIKGGKLDIAKIMEKGPNFDQIMSCSSILKEIKEHIMKIVSDSYNEAFLFSQSFADFYPIFKLGQIWDVREYVFTRDGRPYTGPIAFEPNENDNSPPDDFLDHPDDQPIVDFVRVANDIELFRQDMKRVDGLRSGAIRGAIYIDSRRLKSILIPIPQRSLMELQELLTNLANRKITQLNQALKYYCQKLKIIPQTLDDYVSFCATLSQTIKVMPVMEEEIYFIDKLYRMFDDFGFIHSQNTVHASFSVFKADQTTAQTVRDEYLEMFTDALKSSLAVIDGLINKFYGKATNIPNTIKDADVESKLPHAQKLCSKIQALKTRVTTVIYQQNVMGVKINNFDNFNNLEFAVTFSVKLYEAIGQWLALNNTMTQQPFSQIDMTKFIIDIKALERITHDLNDIQDKQNYPVLNELMTKIQDTLPFLEQLDMLSKGKMQTRHWNLLFEACDRQSAYHADITIEELMNLGILRARDQISEITATSQGEAELEAEFLNITNYWNRVQMPLADLPTKMNEETLLLGPTEPLLNEIQDTLISLSKMLSLPYVQGIRDAVTNLSTTLENLSHIIEAWQLFQSNWVILLALFSMDEAKSILPHQANRFAGVQRKWTAIARYTLKDPRLFQVCAYPALLEVLNENNTTMESILASLGKFIDAKRFLSPRLCFLSNREVLQIATTNVFPELTATLSKIFMHVKRIDCHENDGGENEHAYKSNNISDLKLFGFIGEDGGVLKFDHAIQCKPQVEIFINQTIESMRLTVKKEIVNSLNYLSQTNDFGEWAVNLTSSCYVALIALYAKFTREIEKCIKILVREQHALDDYELSIIQKIKELKGKITQKNDMKLSTLITQLINFRDNVHKLSEYRGNSSLSIAWSQIPKIRHDPVKYALIFEYLDEKFEQGYEFWGKVPRIIYSPSVNNTLSALTFSWIKNDIPLLNSSVSSGKQLLIRSCACLAGSFAYVARAFPDLNEYMVSRLLFGTVSCGTWTIFTNIDFLPERSLCYLFDNVRSFVSSIKSGNTRIIISTHPAELNKNCRIFLTASSKYFYSENIPPQLKSYVRPIALIAPPMRTVINIRLSSLGIKNHLVLAEQLACSIESISIVINQVYPNPSPVTHSNAIIDEATGYINDYKVDHHFAIAFSCYQRFLPACDETRKNILIQIIYSSFNISECLEDLILKIEDFRHEIINKTIRNAIKIELNQMALDLPITYLCEQVVNLLTLMQQNTFVIIVGPPNSGKTTVLNALTKIFDREDVRKLIQGSKPYQVTPLYPQSDTWTRVFGHAYEDLSTGPMFSYGSFQSAFYHLRNYQCKNTILRLDGRITLELSQYLSQLIGSQTTHRLMLNTLDTFSDDHKMHIVFETSNIGDISPLLLTKCGILVMHNIQIASPISPALPVCRLVFPNIPFARSLKQCLNLVDATHIPLIRSIFNEIAPEVVTRVYHTPNIVCYSGYTKRLESATIILSDILTSYAAIIAMNILFSSGSDPSDDKQVKNAIVISFMRVCTGILESKEIAEFDHWLCEKFDVKIPNNWVGFSVSDPFWNCYNKPALYSMRIDKGKLVPLDFTIIDEPPIYIPRLDNLLPMIVDDLTICHAQILPQLKTCDLLLSSHQNIIIHGPLDSGKSSFLRILLRDRERYHPVFINASDSLDTETIISYIALHTPLLSKTAPAPTSKTYVLIFDGVMKQHTEIIEFIRMIVSEHSIPLNSVNDEKVFEFAKINQFTVIVTTRDYKLLPSRFLVNFCPVQLQQISEMTTTFIAEKILRTYNYDEETAESSVRLALMIISQYPNISKLHDLIQVISSLCFLENKDDHHARLSSILSDSFYITLHRYNTSEIAEKVAFICKSECTDENDTHLVISFLTSESIYYPTYRIDRDTKDFIANIEEHPIIELLEDLRDKVIAFNMNAIEKMVLRFTPHFALEWSLLYRAISCPGQSLILEGRTGSCRYTMTRFIANLCECDFVYIADPTPEELLAFEDRKAVIFGILRDVVSNAALQQKKSVIFMRATKKNEREARILADFVSNSDFLPAFSKGTVEELYGRLAAVHNPTYEQRSSAVRQLVLSMRINIHVIIAKSYDCGYDLDYNGFNRVVFDSSIQRSFCEIACDGIDSTATKKVIGQLAPQIIDLLPHVDEISKKYSCCTHPNNYFDFIDTFAHFVAADYQDISTRHENIQSALNFVTKLDNESHIIDKRLDSLAPTLQRLQVDSESLQSSYTTRKEAIVSRRSKLEKEAKSKTEELKELSVEVKDLEENRDALFPEVTKYLKAVEALTNNDIETIRITAVDPQPSLRLLLEVFCLFLDLPPSWERSGQKLLMDPQFVKIIVTRVNFASINQQLLNNVKPYFDSKELNAAELEKNAPALRVLYDWIKTTCDLTRMSITYDTQKAIYDEKKHALDEYLHQMKIELSSIEQVELSLESENKALIQSEASKVQMEREYQQVDVRKKSIDKIYKGLDTITQQWTTESREFSSKRSKVIGDSLIFAFYMVFCGAMSIENRGKALTALYEKVQQAGIESSYANPLQEVRKKFMLASPPDHIDKIPQAALDAHHASTTLRTPLLIDPDGIVTSYLLNSIKSKKLVVVSQYSSTLDQTVAAAISDGKTLFVTDVDSVNPVILSILPLDLITLEPKMSNEIRVGSKLVTWDKKFKLYLISSAANVNRIPDSLTARVSVIDVSSSSLNVAYEFILETFLEFFQPAMIERRSIERKREFDFYFDKMRLENEVLDIIADISATQQANPKYDYLMDDDILPLLLRAKDAYFKMLTDEPEFVRGDEEIKNAIEPFKNHIQLCYDFWRVMSRDLPKVNKSACFTLQGYVKQINLVFNNNGLRQGNLTADQHSALTGSLITATLSYVSLSLPYADTVFYLFITGFFKRAITSKTDERDLNKVLMHIREEALESQCNFVTSDSTTGDTFERLKYTNVSNLFHFISRFIVEQFGPDYVAYMQPFQADQVIPTNSTTPSIVLCQNSSNSMNINENTFHNSYLTNINDNRSSVILDYISQRCKHENLDVISLTDDLELIRSTRKIIYNAQNRGNWVVLFYTSPNIATASMLCDAYTQMSTTTTNTNFRLIIIASSVKYLPPSMLAKCKRVSIDSFPSIRNSVIELLHHYGLTIKSSLNQHSMKKLSYASSILLSLVNFRHFIQPFGFSCPVKPNQVAISDTITILKFIIDKCPSDFLVSNICEEVKRITFASIPEDHDREIVNNLIDQILTRHTLDDDFSIAPNAKDKSRWIIPQDGPVSSFLQAAQGLPAFANPEVLDISAHMLRNWLLAMWITKPFISYGTPKKNYFDFEFASRKIENISISLPNKIGTGDPVKFSSIFGVFLLTEVEQLNAMIIRMKNDIILIQKEYSLSIVSKKGYLLAKNKIPYNWRKMANHWTTTNLDVFIQFVTSSHKQLVKIMKNKYLATFEVSYFLNPKLLLHSFLLQYAVEDKVPVSSLKYEFSTAESSLFALSQTNKDLPRTLTLKGVYLGNGTFNGDLLELDREPKQPPFKPIDSLVCKVVPSDKENEIQGKTCKIPLYQQALVDIMEFDRSAQDVENGISKNLIWEVEFPTQEDPELFLKSGVSLFCRVPEQIL
ncbi:Dynein heavy chain family protein [Tritrichomonas foetus]|uniref:Dynein heavy chain family protein n=1 Tax=Tritrichomonas foetus TaxID=1144522 RepID=A0A1J4K1J7_9EUKA|nr:Dynein heavy chain family protein [Tritrichomonas foetus]|eukprot:OHT03622.1 Dynein heavy chain family protein [Tritrichomonas foetus]